MSEPSTQQPAKRRGCWSAAAVGLLIAIPVGTWLYFAVPEVHEAARTMSCLNGQMQTNLMMQNYVHAHGCFPPAHLADQHGNPAHSWRVLLLPFTNEEERYDRYRFDEAWNSSHNSQLADRPLGLKADPVMYLCPSDFHAGKYDASQVVFVGPHAAFDGPRTRTEKDFSDGTSNTMLGGEISHSGIHWMEPRDLNVEGMSFKINDPNGIGLRSNHSRGVNVFFADGSVRSLNEHIDPMVLKALITIDGGEDVSAFVDQ